MNLIIIEPSMRLSDTRLRVSGQRHEHIVKVLKAPIGSTLSVGILNGQVGTAKIIELAHDYTDLEVVNINSPSPATIPLTLILGLPRPRMLHRTLQTIATMGVEVLHLIQTSRVEKSFWQTPLLKEASVREQLILGLEQGKATQMPEVQYHKRFRPFAEDVLPNLLNADQVKLIAHPGAYPTAKQQPNRSTVLAVGPEGGFIEKEVAYFRSLGFDPIQIGERILRVETAIPVLLGKLF